MQPFLKILLVLCLIMTMNVFSKEKVESFHVKEITWIAFKESDDTPKREVLKHFVVLDEEKDMVNPKKLFSVLHPLDRFYHDDIRGYYVERDFFPGFKFPIKDGEGRITKKIKDDLIGNLSVDKYKSERKEYTSPVKSLFTFTVVRHLKAGLKPLYTEIKCRHDGVAAYQIERTKILEDRSTEITYKVVCNAYPQKMTKKGDFRYEAANLIFEYNSQSGPYKAKSFTVGIDFKK